MNGGLATEVAKILVLTLALASSMVAQSPGFGGGASADPFSMMGSTGSTASSSGWRPWLSVNGNYVRSLSVSQQVSANAPAVGTGSGGVGGYKAWGTKRLAGGYTGSVAYNSTSSPNLPLWRPTQTANLGYSQQVNQRVMISISQMGGLSYGGYGVASGFGIIGLPGTSNSYGAGGNGDASAAFGNPGINGLVDNEVFNGRSLFYAANGSINYLFTNRFAVSGSGSFSTVRRDTGLRGTTSASGSAQVSYRLSQRLTINGGSTYTTNTYKDYFGDVRALFHSGGITYQVSPTIGLSVSAGGGQIKSRFIGLIELPPEVAAIIGVPGSLQVTETSTWSPSYNFSVTKQAEFGSFMAGVSRGFSMGNGVVMAGVRDLAVLTFSRALTQRVGLSLLSSAARTSGRVGVLAATETVQGGTSLSFRLVQGLSLGVNTGIRYVGVPSKSHRSDLYVGAGLSWSPGERPFTF